MDCPKCGFQQLEELSECQRCGIIFARYFADQGEAPGPRTDRTSRVLRRPSFETTDEHFPGRMLAIAAVAGLVAGYLPVISWGISAFVTLFHEIGHTIFAWVLGQPAIPAFDFAFGGGFTRISTFQPLLAIVILGALGWGVRSLRSQPRLAFALAVFLVFWMVAVTAEWRRETVVSAGGALGEVAFAAIFLFMAVTGTGLRSPEVERPVAAFIGFYTAFQTMRFGWGLATDREALELYQQGKGGAMMNDLEIIALNLHIHTPFNPGIEVLARLLMVVIPPVIVAAIYAGFRRLRISG